ncbi:uncharacterized protein EI97DRAFT_456834 [Westerdykella ornata]|uniref:Uncharacterized protein n=1 Tax=Westerdykella ornata TaxID=318751 RepID=A0A6A6JQA9_WESOR|nr:uncharacterized protein EI97DRAFT_456834 [Westerdykella ornata]KAF2278434.1 hypothetical protein EI97DRAFT_456834 [Westerdykella ornata]
MRAIQWATLISVAFAATDSSSSRPEISANSTTASSAVSSQNAGGKPVTGLAASLPDVILPIPEPTATTSSAAPIGNSSVSSATPSPTATGYVNPWEGTYTNPLEPTGTGLEYALQCQNAYYSWTSVNTDYITASKTLYNFTSVIRSETVYEVHTYYTTSYYTLCDGHPRVITSEPTATSTTTLLPSTTTVLAQGVWWASLNEPNCTVAFDDCEKLWTRYSSASEVYQSVSFSSANTIVSLGPGASYWVVDGKTTTFPTPFPSRISLGDEYIHRSIPVQPGLSNYIIVTDPPPGHLYIDDGYTMTAGGPPVTIEHVIDFTNTPYTPHCRTERPTCTAGSRCEISGDRVEIYFFPPPANATLNRDMCAQEPGPFATTRPPTNYTWTPITTGPYTVLPGNTTWYSGNIYVSLNRIKAECKWSNTPVPVGGNYGGSILTMAPSELFSQRAYLSKSEPWDAREMDWEPYAYPFNTDDLISPYPWSAWKGTPDCVWDACTSINGSYNPWIAVPEAIRRLDENWKTCDLALHGLYDPPIALSTVGNIFVTLTTLEPMPQPTPGQQPPLSQVEPTRLPPKPTAPMLAPGDVPGQGPSPEDPPLQNNPGQGNPAQPGPNPQPVPAPTPTTIGTVGDQPIVVIPQPTNPASGGDPANSPGGGPGNGNGAPGQQEPPPAIVIGTQTLQPGSSITIPGGTTIVLPPADNNPGNGNGNGNGNPSGPTQIIVRPPNNAAPSTINIPAGALNPAPAPPAPTTIGVVGGSPVILNPANPSHIHVGGPNGGDLLLAPGVPGVVVGGGTSISMLNPSEILVSAPGQGASTLHIPPVLPAGATPTQGVVVTMPGGEQVTATAVWGPQGSSLVVDGTMVVPGGAAVTLGNGVVVSQAPGQQGGLVVVDPESGATSTLAISFVAGLGQAQTTGSAVLGAVVTIGGKTYTALDQGRSVVIPELGITLTEGGSASVVAGTVLSDGGTGIVVAGTTQTFSSVSLGGGGGNGNGNGNGNGGGNGRGNEAQSAVTSKKGGAQRIGGEGLMMWWVGVCVAVGALAVGL